MKNKILLLLCLLSMLGTNDAHAGWWKEWGHLFCDDYKSMVGNYVGTYTNEAGCREQLVITLKLKE